VFFVLFVVNDFTTKAQSSLSRTDSARRCEAAQGMRVNLARRARKRSASP
jgi:hypothetical protein